MLGKERGPDDPDGIGWWRISWMYCEACGRLIAELQRSRTEETEESRQSSLVPAIEHYETFTVWPKSGSRSCSADVPVAFSADYTEASVVLQDSPKASAALSRRCLQHLLREEAGVGPSTLFNEITAVIESGDLPAAQADALHTLRELGNIAAHTTKSEHSGEIVDVEPGEAEWALDTLDLLFDHYFVQPAEFRRRREAIDARIAEARGRAPAPSAVPAETDSTAGAAPPRQS